MLRLGLSVTPDVINIYNATVQEVKIQNGPSGKPTERKRGVAPLNLSVNKICTTSGDLYSYSVYFFF